ncbi:MAG: DUF4280 domain-containing protein [Bacteroidota bacterium]
MGKNYVCNGAKIKCPLCNGPEGQLMVTSNQIKLQGNFFATEKDNQKANLLFSGTCKKSPFQSSPCAGVISPGAWQPVADTKIQGAAALLEDSRIMCNYGGAQITITDHLQRSEPTKLVPTDMDPIVADVKPQMLVESAFMSSSELFLVHSDNTRVANRNRVPWIQDLTGIENYAVETIEILDLDEGSANDGLGNTQKGMIHGKDYTLRVTKFLDNKEPEYMNFINWEFSYITENGSLVIGVLRETGKEVIFKADDLNLCGVSVKFYAYINNKGQEACLEVFHHYRFRWFDRKIVLRQATDRKRNAWMINQGGTSLCGMACIFYLLAKNHPSGYYDLVDKLHKRGEVTHNGYIVEPHENAKKEMYDTDPATSNDYPRIPEADWITMATTRSKESDFGYVGKEGQDASAINWPWLMINLGKNLLGYNIVKMDLYKINKSYLRDSFGSNEKVRILEGDINTDYQNGYKIFMMIDADMVKRYPGENYSWDDFGEYHWVVYEGNLRLLNSNGSIETNYDKVSMIEFFVYTWGELRDGQTRDGVLMRKIHLTKDQFRANYYGYLKLR